MNVSEKSKIQNNTFFMTFYKVSKQENTLKYCSGNGTHGVLMHISKGIVTFWIVVMSQGKEGEETQTLNSIDHVLFLKLESWFVGLYHAS